MTKKANAIYKIITTITLSAPLLIYLFLAATVFNIQADYAIDNVKFDDVVIADDFLYTTNTEAVYDGVVVFDNGHYGFKISSDDVVKIDNHYYSYQNGSFTDIKEFKLQQHLSYSIPLVFFISLFGAAVVFMVVSKKMQWYKKYPRIAVLVALLTGTVVLYVLSTVLGNILNVFLIATISWAVYLLEYYVKNGIISKDTAEKEENALKAALRKALE